MVERFDYSDEGATPRKSFSDFTDEEILAIGDEFENLKDGMLNEIENPTDNEFHEIWDAAVKQIKEKHNIDRSTLSKISERSDEAKRQRVDEMDHPMARQMKAEREERQQKIELTNNMFDRLSTVDLKDHLDRKKFQLMIMGVENKKMSLISEVAGLIGVDISKPDFYSELNYQQMHLGVRIEDAIGNQNVDFQSLRKLNSNLYTCHTILGNYWYEEFGGEIRAQSISDLISNPDHEYYDLDYYKQRDYLEFILNNTSGAQKNHAVDMALGMLKKDYKKFLDTGVLDMPFEITEENYGEYAYNPTSFEEVKEDQETEYMQDFEQCAYEMLGLAIVHGDASQADEAISLLARKWPDRNNLSRYGHVVPPFNTFANFIVNVGGNPANIVKALETLTDREVATDFIDRLRRFGGGKSRKNAFREAIGKEIAAFVSLESEHPGSIERLKKEFNIEFPGRYPREILLDMLDEKHQSSAYGVVVYPKDDYNTAFHQDAFKLRKLNDQLNKDGYVIRIAEIDGGMNLLKTLLRFNKRFGKDQKISFMILGGHGRKDNIHFSNMPNGNIGSKDIKGQGLKRLADIFDPNATVIMQSCSTGTEKGIAQIISQFFNVKVIAPKVSTSTEEISVIKSSDGLEFNVSYYEDDKSVFVKTK